MYAGPMHGIHRGRTDNYAGLELDNLRLPQRADSLRPLHRLTRRALPILPHVRPLRNRRLRPNRHKLQHPRRGHHG